MKNITLLITLLITAFSFAQDQQQENTFLGAKGSSEWMPESRTNFTYHNNGDSIETYTSMYLNSKWNNYHHDYKVYVNRELRRSFESHWEGPDNNTGEYINEHFTEIEYANVNGIQFKDKTVKYKWYVDSMAWDTSNYTFAKIGLNSQQQVFVVSETSQYKFRGSTLKNISKIYFENDNLGKRTSESVAQWIDSAWVNATSTSIQYGFQSNDVSVRNTYSYTNGTTPFVLLHKTEFSYVSPGYLDSVIVSVWDTASKSYTISSVESYEYNNDIGKLVAKILVGYDQNTSTWYNIKKTTYVYPQSNSINDINPQNIKLYPNPATNLLVIETVSPHTFDIYTSTGQLVTHQDSKAKKTLTSIEELKAGIYYAHIKLSNNHIITRKIIKN